jgi:hypothetical protein
MSLDPLQMITFAHKLMMNKEDGYVPNKSSPMISFNFFEHSLFSIKNKN